MFVYDHNVVIIYKFVNDHCVGNYNNEEDSDLRESRRK